MARRGMRWAVTFLAVWFSLFAPWSVRTDHAAVDVAMELRAVSGDDSERAAQALDHLKAAGDLAALPALQALDDGSLRVDTAGNPFIQTKTGVKPALPGGPAQPNGALKSVEADN